MTGAIRLLREDDWAAFQQLRIHATVESPLAIWPTREEETRRTPDEVRARIAPTAHQAVFGAFVGHHLIAIAGVRREPLAQVAHKAMLWGVYVHPAHRRGGLARRLLDAACAHARAQGVLQIHLAVNVENPRTLRVNGVFYDEIFMALPLDAVE